MSYLHNKIVSKYRAYVMVAIFQNVFDQLTCFASLKGGGVTNIVLCHTRWTFQLIDKIGLGDDAVKRVALIFYSQDFLWTFLVLFEDFFRTFFFGFFSTFSGLSQDFLSTSRVWH